MLEDEIVNINFKKDMTAIIDKQIQIQDFVCSKILNGAHLSIKCFEPHSENSLIIKNISDLDIKNLKKQMKELGYKVEIFETRVDNRPNTKLAIIADNQTALKEALKYCKKEYPNGGILSSLTQKRAKTKINTNNLTI